MLFILNKFAVKIIRRFLSVTVLAAWRPICTIIQFNYAHLYNFKRREKHPWRSVTFSKVARFKVVFHSVKISARAENSI